MSPTSSSRRRPSASQPKLVQEKPVQEKPVRNKPVQKKPPLKTPIPKTPIPQTPRQRELTTKRRGELAELTFVLKAANLGFGVARPYGDSERYDVILDARDISVERTNVERIHVERIHVERAPSPAAFDFPAASGSKNSGKNNRDTKNENNRPTKNEKNKAKRKPMRIPLPQPPEIPTAPDPSPPLWRVQVKCSTQISTGLYRVNAHRRANGRAVPYLPGEIHFFAAYIIPEDTWYILPLHALRGVTSLLFRRRRDRRPGLYDAYREAWHLLRPK